MKVYILFKDVDYEGSDVIRVCKNKMDAQSRLAYLNENQSQLRDSIGEKNDLWKWWEKEYKGYPVDGYHMEEWEVL